MKKIFFVLTFMLVSSFAFANPYVECKTDNDDIKTEISLDNYNLDYQIISLSYDVCTVTVSLFQNGVLVARASWTDNTGDCDLALAGATMMAYNQL